MEQSHRRYFVWAYYMCMTTKLTAFYLIPPRRLVIYLKFWIFEITKSVIVLQRRVYAHDMKYMYCVKYFQIFLVWEARYTHLIINWKTVRFQIPEQNDFPLFSKCVVKKFTVNLIAFWNKLLYKYYKLHLWEIYF